MTSARRCKSVPEIGAGRSIRVASRTVPIAVMVAVAIVVIVAPPISIAVMVIPVVVFMVIVPDHSHITVSPLVAPRSEGNRNHQERGHAVSSQISHVDVSLWDFAPPYFLAPA